MIYSASTQLYPAIILICQPKRTESAQATDARCSKYYHRLEDAVTDPRWPIPMTVWRCHVADARLADCEREDLTTPSINGSKSRANHP